MSHDDKQLVESQPITRLLVASPSLGEELGLLVGLIYPAHAKLHIDGPQRPSWFRCYVIL
ncbi:MAG: hypothetical protein KatS3mg113_0396 [Planctomycetaceae bacterium]|nr:MAG: hypothetical protein KatS3mg113_0396 [Planctomycetaceae bacterium]